MAQVFLYKAEAEDLDWVNHQYDSIGFKPSVFNNETIIIAEVGGNPSGLGRLVKITEEVAELGGMYVLPSFRGQKIAEKIVGELLNYKGNYQKIYCLPFSHLENFYKRFGFRDLQINERRQIPQELAEKLEWCRCTYKDKTSILVI